MIPRQDDSWRITWSLRRSPRLAGESPNAPIVSPVTVRRVDKLQVRRKLSTLFDQEGGDGEQTGYAQESPNEGRQTGYDQVRVDGEEQSFYAEEVDDEDYWSEDSQFSHLDIEETEVEGDLVEEEELFGDGSHDNLIDVVNNNINQSCRRVTGKGKTKLIDVDDLDVRVGEELDVNSDEDISVAGSGDDEAKLYDTFDPAVDFERPIILKKGLKFPCVEVYRKVVRQHAIENGYEPYFEHNDSTRVTVYCRHRCECPWNAKRSRLPKCTCGAKRKCKFRLYAAKLKGDTTTFQIKTLYLDHIC
ncbi:uncharacterized protein LOC141590130 [Silene latifolia]|uniref:uncharacterized protein LOC141590130 n=1 Tax=Silene latifolia TaxID=37657 RepID=UPI003D777159